MENTTDSLIPGQEFSSAGNTSSDNFLILLGTPIFLENILALIVLFRCEKLVFQVRSLALNLTFADCLIGLLLIIPYRVFELIFSCRVKKYLNFIAVSSSIMTATLINVDRCISIHYGIRYIQIVTKRRLQFVCAMTWIFSLLLSYVIFFDPQFTGGINCQSHFSPSQLNTINIVGKVVFRLIVFMNIPFYVYMVYYVKVKAEPVPLVTENGIELIKFCSERDRTLRKLTVISSLLIGSNLPAYIVNDLAASWPSTTIQAFKFIAEILLLSNSLINPVLYVWRFYEARYQLYRLIFVCDSSRRERLFKRRKQFFATFDINSLSTESPMEDNSHLCHFKVKVHPMEKRNVHEF